jgi:hypothetical protein
MKQIIILFLAAVMLSSCLKQSIADAMLASMNVSNSGNFAVMSYDVNNNPVTITAINNYDGQMLTTDSFVRCTKTADYYGNPVDYNIQALSTSGNRFDFDIYTDSLTVGNYSFDSLLIGIPYDVLVYNNITSAIYSSTDTLSINITSYSKGYINGNFTARLTPDLGIWGTPGSTVITNGSFKNVQVFY